MADIIATDDTTFGTPEGDQIRGRPEQPNNIFALEGDDRIFGGTEFDFIDAGDGDDIVLALDGLDVVFGGSGNDFIAGFGGTDGIFGQGGNDTIFGMDGDDGLVGGDGSDTIIGGDGADTLAGNSGNDRLIGGLSIFGGGDGEADTFRFNFGEAFFFFAEPDQGNDLIEAFERGTDVIQVSGLAESLDTNGNGQLDDGDARVDANPLPAGSFLTIDFDGVPLADGGRAAGFLTVTEVAVLDVGSDIFFL